MAMPPDENNILNLLRNLLLDEQQQQEEQLNLDQSNFNSPSMFLPQLQLQLQENSSSSIVNSPCSLESLFSAQQTASSSSPSSVSSAFPLLPIASGSFTTKNGFSPFQSSSSALPTSSIASQLEAFDSQIRVIADEIQSTIQMHLNGLQLRKEHLLKQLEHIKQTYRRVLIHQHANQQNFPLPLITFTKPDSALYKAITSLGFLTTPAFAVNCTASGDGLEVAVQGANSVFIITTRNCFNEELLIGNEKISIEIEAVDDNSNTRTIIQHSIMDHNNGKYTCTYSCPPNATHCEINTHINGLPVAGSPFMARCEMVQNRQTWKNIATFGVEGNQLGEFCRPWGVAIAQNSIAHESGEREYLLAVADRSNNRIQLIKMKIPTGEGQAKFEVIHAFGSGPGTRPGQFDRPAGIAINEILGHIIVADKDNHRVQVFDLTGHYQFKFGEKGSRVGQFCYPWDIDACPVSHQIVVSDTRNRRVQLFTSYGQYLSHISQPLDSPRGVAFMGDKIVISDFNKHRLLIVDKVKDDSAPKYVGFGEGSGWGEFLRPQGVVTNSGFNIFCADSRNNRICVWNCISQGFEYLNEDIMVCDRPSGLAVADNILVIVDFGNNRLQICQR